MQNMVITLPQSFLTEIKTFHTTKKNLLHNTSTKISKIKNDISIKQTLSSLQQQKQKAKIQIHSIVAKGSKMTTTSSKILSNRQNVDDYISNYVQKPKIIRFNSASNRDDSSTSFSSSSEETLSQLEQYHTKTKIYNVLSQFSESLDSNIIYTYDRFGIKIINSEDDDTDEKDALNEKLIISKRGTIRGNLNRVKASLKQLFKESTLSSQHSKNKINFLERDYVIEEENKIIIYTTSLQIIRNSFENCQRVKKILLSHCVRYEEHDLFKCKEYQRELKYRLNIETINIPQVFFNGKHIGNCDQLESLSDQGYLNKLFKNLEKIKLRIYCYKCGGYRYVLCTHCNGSKKKYNNFTYLKCTICNEDGLLRCDSCLDQQE